MRLHTVILAAGKGTRMRSVLPKVLHCLAAKPLLQHVLDTASGLQAIKTTIVYGQQGDWLQNSVHGSELDWVCQTALLGTGHALAQAVTQDELTVFSHVLVLYGDVPLVKLSSLQKMLDQAKKEAELIVLTAHVAEPLGFGRIIRDSAGVLQAIVEEQDASELERQCAEINSGIMLCSLALLQHCLPLLQANNAQGEYYLTDIVRLARDYNAKIATVRVSDALEVQGVNDRIQLSVVERYYQRRQAQALMRNGVTLADPNRIDIRGTLKAAEDVFIDINCIFEGEVQLSAGVNIGPNCLIKNSKISKNVTIYANTVIDGAIIDAGAIIGPFARLRPETHIAEAGRVGNFVELKKTRLGKASKVNHLSYIGDAVIGAKVNVGAGVITCNYDGVNKHQTIIKDDAFIGSSSQLVAPVIIEAGTTVGAGSTITENTLANSLTLARAKQITISGWSRPIKKL